MNAYELADGLAQMYIEKDVNGLFNKRIQNMLRQFGLAESIIKQQQLEIEALKEPKIPLLEQEIKFILGNGQCWQGEDCSMPNLMYIIRAVEGAHGIGVKQNEQ